MSDFQGKTADWYAEASAVINDVKQHVKSIEISEKLITGSENYFSVIFSGNIEFVIFIRCWHLHKLEDT